jgi:hypothetical protein
LEGIKTVELSSIATEITDGTRVKRNYIDEGIRLINVGDFKDGTILFFAREISSLLQKFFPRHRWGNFMSTPATLAAKSHMFSADSRSLLL